MKRELNDYVSAHLDFTDNTEPCTLYRTWVAISNVSAALQRRCWLDLGMEVFYPNTSIVLVGPPAARKGTAIRPGQRVLADVGIAVSADESSKSKLITAMIDARNEFTWNGRIVYHSSLMAVCSELTVFIGYKNVDLLQTLCKWLDCESNFIDDTHIRGRRNIPNVCISILGATTPALIQASLPQEAVGGGFTSRTIFVFAQDKEKVVEIPVLSEAQRAIYEKMKHDLGSMLVLSGEFTPTEEFLEAYIVWRQAAELTHFADMRLEYYAQRRPAHLLKLSMIFSASRSSDMHLRLVDFERAANILRMTEGAMEQVFVGVGKNPMAGVLMRFLAYMAMRKIATLAEVQRAFFNDVSAKDLNALVQTAVQMGHLRIDTNFTNISSTRLIFVPNIGEGKNDNIRAIEQPKGEEPTDPGD